MSVHLRLSVHPFIAIRAFLPLSAQGVSWAFGNLGSIYETVGDFKKVRQPFIVGCHG
jgi:hypothetical protein